MEHSLPFFVNVDSPTWLLYVSLLMVAVFFRFSRFFSVRNLDLAILLSLSTALVLFISGRGAEDNGENDVAPSSGALQTNVESVAAEKVSALAAASDVSVDSAAPVADEAETAVAEPTDLAVLPTTEELEPPAEAPWSSVVVISISVLLIIRLTLDESLTRRPRLEQNLNQAGLTFLFLPAFAILMSGVFLKPPPQRNFQTVEAGAALLTRQESVTTEAQAEAPPPPTPVIMAAAAAKVTELSGQGRVPEVRSSNGVPTKTETNIARILVVLAHTMVVLGLLYIGRRHFSSVQLGVSMSCLYLLLPCTAYNVHELSHVVPAACLTWAFASYRRPAVAGILLGLACGTLFFAAFLIPLWAVFYGRKGGLRFGLSLCAVVAIVLLACALTSANTDSFINKLVKTANWTAYRLFDAAEPMPPGAIGQAFLRITLAAVFFVMLIAMTVIPRKRNLENLLSNSTALIVAAQLWYPDDVGSYVLWYLPLLLLVIFRPRLDRFVPPESPNTMISKEQPGQSSMAAGAMARVTLYN